MNTIFIAGIIFLCFGIVLLKYPTQLFERNYPVVTKYIKAHKYTTTTLKVINCIFIIIGLASFLVAIIL